LLVLEEDGIVKLFLYLDLGPGLLFTLSCLGLGTFCCLSILGRAFTRILSTYLLLLSL
jgi:hypothetical protein